jgi:phosphatidylglycerophosphatase A
MSNFNLIKNLFFNSVKSQYQIRKQTVPTYAFMLKKFSRIVAFGFGSGLSAIMPGTVGTFFALIAFNLLHLQSLSLVSFSLVFCLLLWLGSWACNQTQHSLGKQDSGYIVFDEWLSIWLCLWVLSNGLPLSLGQQLIIFFVFRCFDILKPFPIKYVESYFKQKVKPNSLTSGFGVMIDDVLAAIYTILIIKIF